MAQVHQPAPAICLQDPEVPAAQSTPELPPLLNPPLASATHDLAWWRSVAEHFQSRALRAELTTSFASNVADAERDARQVNALRQTSCATVLRERDAAPAE